MTGPRILLVVGGGIAAYKSCELVREIRKGGGEVTCVLTDGGAKFVTAMALAALSENPVHTTLWDLKNEVEMGHIQLSRQADLVVVCPATANLVARMAHGIADDLATTLLLATDKPVLAVPAMNVRMWQHAATVRNVAVLRESGVEVMEPDEGAMACGEYGPGRLPEPPVIWQRIAAMTGLGDIELAPLPGSEPDPPPMVPEPPAFTPAARPGAGRQAAGLSGMMAKSAGAGPVLVKKGSARAAPPTDPDAINHEFSPHGEAMAPDPVEDGVPAQLRADPLLDPLAGQPDFEDAPAHRPLFGRHMVITAGPTWEAIDPVRYIANRSSGKQGFAIAAAAAEAGARVTLVAGPCALPTPPGVDRVDVESAREMADAVKRALPADIGVMVAAVADWRPDKVAGEKIKKRGHAPPVLMLTENPDILATVAASPKRPRLLVGFAAETEDVIHYAKEKRVRKAADWIVANDVSGDVMGGDRNLVHVISEQGVETLPEMPKADVARGLVERMANALK